MKNLTTAGLDTKNPPSRFTEKRHQATQAGGLGLAEEGPLMPFLPQNMPKLAV